MLLTHRSQYPVIAKKGEEGDGKNLSKGVPRCVMLIYPVLPDSEKGVFSLFSKPHWLSQSYLNNF